MLECGHKCALFCHGYDMEHFNIKCEQPCLKICCHKIPCKKLCHEECDPCEFNEDGNCYYKPLENVDSTESILNEEVKVAQEEYSRNAEISFLLDGERPKFHKK
uniref:Uncharacterized protein n=1 Tax=Panagrolaimus superbus TaxID=310955 RepID=A0A914YD26_9BILA